jgi:glutathione synthase/RimK-type ligase-like ATP-grasp enzyme
VSASIAIATCAARPDGDPDETVPLTRALADVGVRATWLVWSEPTVDWSAFDAVVIRSTWDYTDRRDEFLEWVVRTPGLVNPAEVVVWNSDKVYLRDLRAAGVPIVDTEFFAPGSEVVVPDVEFIVKPSVGAGSRGAGRFTPDRSAAAIEHAQALLAAGRTVLVQPYAPDVDTAGETALVYFGGRFSHAIRKGAMLPPASVYRLEDGLPNLLYVEENITPREPEAAELEVGEQVLEVLRDRFDRDLLYVRVDLLPTPGGPVLIELEATEPSLFLQHDAGAAQRLAAEIARRYG